MLSGAYRESQAGRQSARPRRPTGHMPVVASAWPANTTTVHSARGSAWPGKVGKPRAERAGQQRASLLVVKIKTNNETIGRVCQLSSLAAAARRSASRRAFRRTVRRAKTEAPPPLLSSTAPLNERDMRPSWTLSQK